jgi:hypothetical protein
MSCFFFEGVGRKATNALEVSVAAGAKERIALAIVLFVQRFSDSGHSAPSMRLFSKAITTYFMRVLYNYNACQQCMHLT